jgi:hypothetical protein
MAQRSVEITNIILDWINIPFLQERFVILIINILITIYLYRILKILIKYLSKKLTNILLKRVK